MSNEMNDQMKAVLKFHETYKCNINHKCAFPDIKERDLRISLLNEEFGEYLHAEKSSDMVEVADALGDILYIIIGTCISYGIPLDTVFDEIQRSNMSKLDENGKPIFRDDGKVLKGKNYSKPDIATILKDAGLE